MVNLKDIDPTILIEIKWATPDNMLGKVVYQKNTCYLRRATAEKLAEIQKGLRAKGLGLKVWEGYRPMWMQQYLWDTVQDPNLISHPSQGRRTHSRGIAVDVTLVDAEGKELAMPTGYCEFEKAAEMKHNFQRLPEAVLKNRETLKNAMVTGGFQLYQHEWWHYNLPNWSDFPILSEDEWAPPAPGIEVK